MANAYIVNQVPSSYGAAMKLLADMLVSAGWTIQASGDGLSAYSSSASVFSSGGSGANGWNNSGAWARIQDPGGVREIILQHNAAGGARIKYSPSAQFTGGSPSATQTPSATDERYLRGASSDASPSYGATFFGSGVATSAVRFQGAAMGTAPYGFWFAGASTGAGAIRTGLVMDPVTSVPEDPDPVVWYIGTTAAFTAAEITSGTNSGATGNINTSNGGTAVGGYAIMDTGLVNFVRVAGCSYSIASQAGGANGTSTVEGTRLVVNPFNAKNDALPIPWLRDTFYASTPQGLKGWSTMMRWTTIARTQSLDTLDNKNWICMGAVWLPWDGASLPSNA